MWLYGLFSAISIKFFSSVDDVVWLTPFLTSTLTPALQLQNATIYTCVCLVQTFVAMSIAFSGEKTVKWLLSNEEDAWSADKVLTVTAGCLMVLFGAKELYNHFYGENDDDDEGPTASRSVSSVLSSPKSDEVAKYNKVATVEEKSEFEPLALAMDMESGGEEVPKRHSTLSQERGPCKLFQIAFIGSIDDLTLFVPMLVGKAFDPLQLVLGSLTAACCIVALCTFIGLCKPIANFLSNVPLWFIIMGFATFLLIEGARMK